MDGTDHHLRAVAAAGYYLTRVLALMVAAALDTGSVASPGSHGTLLTEGDIHGIAAGAGLSIC